MRTIIESQIPWDLAEQVAFAKLDIDPQPHHEICLQHRILNVPFLAFYSDGSLFRTNTGLLMAEALIGHLRDLVESTAE